MTQPASTQAPIAPPPDAPPTPVPPAPVETSPAPPAEPRSRTGDSLVERMRSMVKDASDDDKRSVAKWMKELGTPAFDEQNTKFQQQLSNEKRMRSRAENAAKEAGGEEGFDRYMDHEATLERIKGRATNQGVPEWALRHARSVEDVLDAQDDFSKRPADVTPSSDGSTTEFADTLEAAYHRGLTAGQNGRIPMAPVGGGGMPISGAQSLVNRLARGDAMTTSEIAEAKKAQDDGYYPERLQPA